MHSCTSTAALTVCSALVQAMGRSVSADDFKVALLSGTHFAVLMKQADSVAGCAVPPGAPSIIDTTLNGLKDLGRLLQLCAPEWWVLALSLTVTETVHFRH
jgi:hypothetical protein